MCYLVNLNHLSKSLDPIELCVNYSSCNSDILAKTKSGILNKR
ncbi:hypothetical protein DDB_G0290353 [Dictyostelium discoideum AX4]|nr:hypothetical protein DDB_G0290353 [Dictyostelium discoideum AX4]EAL62303.1 hypothetical protein DDB_G0290353 [Dictyostelium discoideum AX4]|eukprot:XP_635778.1 hypothetical protein DDB_G0290353 [Dictyostelium discoideum AX4]